MLAEPFEAFTSSPRAPPSTSSARSARRRFKTPLAQLSTQARAAPWVDSRRRLRIPSWDEPDDRGADGPVLSQPVDQRGHQPLGVQAGVRRVTSVGERWLIDTYAGLWLFTSNHSFYPGTSDHTQEPIGAFQAHVSYSITRLTMAEFSETPAWTALFRVRLSLATLVAATRSANARRRRVSVSTAPRAIPGTTCRRCSSKTWTCGGPSLEGIVSRSSPCPLMLRRRHRLGQNG